MWQVILWSFRVLISGVWPARDWNREPFDGWRWERRGQPIAGGLRFAIFQIAADLDYLCNYLALQHFNHGTNPCFRCGANRSDIPFTDLRPTAGWRSCLVDSGTWFFRQKHAVFEDKAIGLNLFHVQLDLLHILDLGVAQHLAGSILYLLVFDCGFEGSFEDKASVVWTALCKAYVQLGTLAGERYPEVLFSRMFDKCGHTARPKQYPQLFSKAAVARHSIPALRLMVRDLVDWAPNSLMNNESITTFGHVNNALDSLSNFYDCLFQHELWLPETAGQELRGYLRSVGLHHQALTHHFMTKGRQLFFLTEKAHYLQHVGEDCYDFRMNPRYGWTYSDEDWMGRIAGIAKACTRARGPLRLAEPVFERWRNRMYIAWTRRARGS